MIGNILIIQPYQDFLMIYTDAGHLYQGFYDRGLDEWTFRLVMRM